MRTLYLKKCYTYQHLIFRRGLRGFILTIKVSMQNRLCFSNLGVSVILSEVEESVNISKMVMLTLSDSSLRLRRVVEDFVRKMTETSCNFFTCES